MGLRFLSLFASALSSLFNVIPVGAREFCLAEQICREIWQNMARKGQKNCEEGQKKGTKCGATKKEANEVNAYLLLCGLDPRNGSLLSMPTSRIHSFCSGDQDLSLSFPPIVRSQIIRPTSTDGRKCLAQRLLGSSFGLSLGLVSDLDSLLARVPAGRQAGRSAGRPAPSASPGDAPPKNKLLLDWLSSRLTPPVRSIM